MATSASHRDEYRSIWTALILLTMVMASGTIAYRVVEGWGLLDSFYMTVITLSTVGFGEVRTLSPTGRVITIAVILSGLVSVSLLVGSLTRILLEGELRRIMGRRRVEREVGRLRDHWVVCGYGRVGRVVVQELAGEGVSLVVIDDDDKVLQRVADDGQLAVKGDATEEATLQLAGIERAQGLILCLPHEADSVYVTLAAKDLYPDLFILARSISENGDRRLLAAGADRVVSPNIIGGHRLAQSVLRPSVVEFVDIVTGRRALEELQLEELQVGEKSGLSDRSIRECDIRGRFGLMVVGLVTAGGELVFNPSPSERIDVGSTLIVLGKREDLDRFRKAL